MAPPLLPALLLCSLRAALAFNILPSGALVFSQPGSLATTGDYFGYSVAFASTVDGRNWMMVSAPRKTSKFEEPQFKRSGSLYRCPPSGGNCAEMNFVQNSRDSDLDPMQLNNGSLGGAMDARLGNNGMVVCNPLYKYREQDYLDMPGTCYWLYDIQADENEEVPRRKMGRDEDAEDYILNGETWKDVHRTPQLGFSVYQFEGKGEHLLIGGPGLFAGQGTVALFRYNFRESESKQNYGVVIPQLMNDSYFGYSVTAGFFQPSHMSNVGSAPRAEDLRGKVIVFNYKNETADMNMIIIEKELNGEQIGEYFGASLTVADINHDGIDELLVGAPLHSFGTGDEGKINLYMTSRKNKNGMLEIKESIVPKLKIPNARFGTSIASLGDIDDDGYADVAVGAPYEDSERGTIYIFYGSPESPYLKHERRIRASDLSNQLKGFGFSFSRGDDIDQNTYNDLGVGAYLSDHAVLLRTSPVLRFHSSVRIRNAEKIPMNDSRVDIIVCVRPNKLLEDTGIEVTMNIDPVFSRGSINEKRRIKYNLSMTATNVKDECQGFQIALKNNTKVYKPLEIELSYRILYPTPKSGQFCKTCPVLDFKSPKSYHYIHFQTGCEGKICKTNLTLKGSFIDTRSPFVIGSNNKSSIEMVLEVANLLEPSYETNISISFPSAIRLRQSHQSCYKLKDNSTDITNLICEVPYMLDKSQQPFSLNVHFDIDSIPWEINKLQVNVLVEGSGEEQNVEDNSMILLLELRHVADISIKGRSSVENIPFAIKRNDSEDYIYLDRTFEHIYTIINNGPSPVRMLNLKFMIPHKVKDGETTVTYLNVYPTTHSLHETPKRGKENTPAYDVSQKIGDPRYLNLDCSLPEVECLVINYVTDTIYAKHGVTVSFKIMSPLKELGPFITQSGVYVRTQGDIENEFILKQDLGSKTYFTAEAETWLNGKVLSQERVQDWIIIVAVICGILILGILCIVLWKLGFFKRNKPPTGEEKENGKPDTSEKMDTEPLYEENA